MKKLYQEIDEPIPYVSPYPTPPSLKKHRYSTYLVPLFVLLSIFPFFYLSGYNHPSADDFCYTTKAMQMSYWATQANYYTTWTGRFAATALLTLDPINHLDLTAYRLLPILLFVLFGIALYVFCSETIPNLTRKDKVGLSFAIFFLYVLAAPNITEAFYWMSGSLTYQLASILTLALISLILRLTRTKEKQRKIFFTIIACLISAIIVGLNETSMMVVCIGLFVWTAAHWLINKRIEIWHLSLLFVTTLASGVVIAAPGNLVRLGAKPTKFQFFFSVYGSAKAAFIDLIHWIPVTVLLLLICSPLLNRVAAHAKSYYKLPKFSLLQILLAGLVLCGFLALCYFPAFWSQGGVPPTRTINMIYFLYLIGCFGLAIALFTYLQEKGVVLPTPSIGISLVLGLLLLIYIGIRPNNLATAYKDIFSGKAQKYSQEMQQRYALLSNCALESCTIPALTYKPATIFAYDMASSPTQEVYYYNQCMADYFKNTSILTPSN